LRPLLGPLPSDQRYVLANALVPACLIEGATLAPDEDGFARVAIGIADGRITGVDEPADQRPRLDLEGRVVFPTFVELHTHLDKGHIWPRRRNPDGTFLRALDQVALDRERHWSAEDVARRMDFSLRCAHAHGTSAVRTHLDSIGDQTEISWPVFAEMRERWRGRIALQAVALFSIEHVADPAHMSRIRAALIEHDGVLGGVTYMVPSLEDALDALFRLASDEGLDLDFHVDETLDPEARSLIRIADAALRVRFGGQVTVGHCCSLAQQGEDEAKATIDRVAQAGLAVVSLPMCNLYLQDREHGRTPRSRGVTLLHELRRGGVQVAISSDNTRDPFYAYGDLDMLEVYREATRIAHLDHPVGDWPRAATATPARIMGIPGGTIGPGREADLVLFRARSFNELMARPEADRVVLRSGRPIDTTLPDYAELDALMETPR
jgi:cytosine/creatinine deaminase